jgi:HSF-type DNA-binding
MVGNNNNIIITDTDTSFVDLVNSIEVLLNDLESIDTPRTTNTITTTTNTIGNITSLPFDNDMIDDELILFEDDCYAPLVSPTPSCSSSSNVSLSSSSIRPSCEQIFPWFDNNTTCCFDHNLDDINTSVSALHCRDDDNNNNHPNNLIRMMNPNTNNNNTIMMTLNDAQIANYTKAIENNLIPFEWAAATAASATTHSAKNTVTMTTTPQLTNSRSTSTSNNNTGSFPHILYHLLEQASIGGYEHIVSWQCHGRAFRVHDSHQFVQHVMPQFFQQTRYPSFQRQLALYGFVRITRQGLDRGAYYNERFLRGYSQLCSTMIRTPIKGNNNTITAGLSSHLLRKKNDPDFYSMSPLPDIDVSIQSAATNNSSTITTNATSTDHQHHQQQQQQQQYHSYTPMTLSSLW